MQVSRHTGPCYCFLIFGLSQSLPVSGLIKLNPVNYTTERNGPSVQPKAECFSFLWMYCVLSFCCNCLVTKLCLDSFVTPWTAAHQTPLSTGFSRQEYWSGLPLLLQGIFLTQGSNPSLLHLLHWQVGSLPRAPQWKPLCYIVVLKSDINTVLNFTWSLRRGLI